MKQKALLKRFLVLPALFVLITGSHPVYSEPILSRDSQFSFTYQVTVDPIPGNAGAVKVWVPVAQSDAYQKILDLKVKSPYPYQILEDKQYGNKILNRQAFDGKSRI